MKPSDIDIYKKGGVLPLIGSKFNQAELEFAASLLIVASRKNGDEWKPLDPKAIGLTMRDSDEFKGFATNPFMPFPDFRDLVKKGFAKFHGDPNLSGTPVEFTEAGFDVIREYMR